MSKISSGKFKEMLDALFRYFPEKGKGFSLDWEHHFRHPTGLLFISQLRGKGRREAGKVL